MPLMVMAEDKLMLICSRGCHATLLGILPPPPCVCGLAAESLSREFSRIEAAGSCDGRWCVLKHFQECYRTKNQNTLAPIQHVSVLPYTYTWRWSAGSIVRTDGAVHLRDTAHMRRPKCLIHVFIPFRRGAFIRRDLVRVPPHQVGILD